MGFHVKALPQVKQAAQALPVLQAPQIYAAMSVCRQGQLV